MSHRPFLIDMADLNVESCSKTLPELLYLRARQNPQEHAAIHFLDSTGHIEATLTPAGLLQDAQACAQRLLHAGCTPLKSVVLGSFSDHYSHIRLFWACVLARIPFCPLPALHPDPSRQILLFEHLQRLFGEPTLVASKETLDHITALVPTLRVLDYHRLLVSSIGENPSGLLSGYTSPEETVCYMLTSGSTGNAKAVTLDHATLLSSSRGKIERNGTTASSSFLNWIAFDHVASVSEIHIHALLANAT